jgi:hypothetical protein
MLIHSCDCNESVSDILQLINTNDELDLESLMELAALRVRASQSRRGLRIESLLRIRTRLIGSIGGCLRCGEGMGDI